MHSSPVNMRYEPHANREGGGLLTTGRWRSTYTVTAADTAAAAAAAIVSTKPKNHHYNSGVHHRKHHLMPCTQECHPLTLLNRRHSEPFVIRDVNSFPPIPGHPPEPKLSLHV